MNIAIFTDAYPPYINGVSTSTYNLVQVLKAHGHNVIVIAPRFTDGPVEMIDDVIYMPGIPIKKVYNMRITVLYSRKIVRYLEQYQIDLIHFQDDATIGHFGKLAAKHLKVPTVYTYHTQYEDYTTYLTKGLLDRIAKRFMRYYTRRVSKQVAGYISPSLKTKDYLRRIKTDVNISVIPTGIDFSLFTDDKFDQEKAKIFRKEHNIHENTKVFLVLGRLGREKSMDVSLRCFAHYKETHPDMDLKLLLVGGGPLLEELQLLCGELNINENVDFIGPVPAGEVAFYYHLADIYTSASLTETQGLTFMESMAAGTIVLARYDDQLASTIIEGESGFFFTDASSFAEKADRIFALSKQEIEQIDRKVKEVLQVYSIDKFYQDVMVVYKRALKKFW